VNGREKPIAEYQSDSACESCNGDRLKEEALCVKIDDHNISEVTRKSILDAAKWFKELEKNLDKRQFKIAEHVLKEINERLNFLLNVGLDYLTLSREVRNIVWWRSSKNKISFTNRIWIDRCIVCS
jgi:excinuclease ABC subunit A